MVADTTHSHTRPQVIGGFGLPTTDFITPTAAEYDAGLALIRQTPDAALIDASHDARAAKADGESSITAAKQALNDFHAFMEKNDFVTADHKPAKGKKDLTPEQEEAVAGWFAAMLRGAQDINRVAEALGTPEARVTLRHLGGSMINKFHAIKAGLGDAVQPRVMGAYGEEDSVGTRARKMRDTASSGIQLTELEDVSGAPVNQTAHSYITQMEGDRVVLRAPGGPLSQKIGKNLSQITRFISEPALDQYFIEGGDFSHQKFGEDAFLAFADAAMASGKPIIFSLPTSTDMMVGDTLGPAQRRQLMFELIDHPNTQFISCNEDELSSLLLHRNISKTKPLTENPDVAEGIKELQARLAYRQRRHPSTPEPVAFVSIGPEGAYAVTATTLKFSPARADAKVVNNLGAGDAFFAGAYIKHQQLLARGVTGFDEATLQEMLDLGQTLAFHTVQQKGAQVASAKITELVHGDVPRHGTVEGVDLPTQHRSIE